MPETTVQRTRSARVLVTLSLLLGLTALFVASPVSGQAPAKADPAKADPKATPQEQQKQTDQRNEAMTKAQENQQKAADQLQQALDRMKNIGTLQKAIESIALETRETLEGPSGFGRLKFSRGELYLYNIRHLQHHTGQLSAYLRKLSESFQDPTAVRWAFSGWR